MSHRKNRRKVIGCDIGAWSCINHWTLQQRLPCMGSTLATIILTITRKVQRQGFYVVIKTKLFNDPMHVFLSDCAPLLTLAMHWFHMLQSIWTQRYNGTWSVWRHRISWYGEDGCYAWFWPHLVWLGLAPEWWFQQLPGWDEQAVPGSSPYLNFKQKKKHQSDIKKKCGIYHQNIHLISSPLATFYRLVTHF